MAGAGKLLQLIEFMNWGREGNAIRLGTGSQMQRDVHLTARYANRPWTPDIELNIPDGNGILQ